jgi:hypothetical protein
MKRSSLAICAILVLAPLPAAAVPFPADSAFVPLSCRGGGVMTDPAGDDPPFLGQRDVIGDATATATDPAGLRAADATYLYLRIRLDGDPAPGGSVSSGAWGMAFDLDGDLRTYELLVLAEGITGPAGTVSVFRNTTTTTLNDRTDPADLPAAATYTFAANARTVQAATTTSGNPDFFVDLAIPWSALAPLGLDRGTPTYVWVASSSMTDRLDGDFACVDERTGPTTLDGAASSATTGDPAGGPGGGGGGDQLEGGGGCAAGGGGASPAALVIVAAALARRRARVTPGSATTAG